MRTNEGCLQSRRRTTKRRTLLCGSVLAVLMFPLIASGTRDIGSLTITEALKILQSGSFRIVDRVSEIPREALVSAKVIAADRKVDSFIVEKNKEYQHGDASIDPDRPQRQIILAGISKDYLFLCFWRGGQVEARYFMLLNLQKVKARVVFYSTLDGDVRNFSDVKQLLQRNQISPLTFEPDR